MENLWISHGSQNDNADINLILFTYAGGSPSLFAPWKKIFDSSVNLCPVLYPGREKRRKEEMPDSVQDMAKQFVEANEVLFQKKYVLFGHCTGTLVAYEVASYLKEKYNSAPLAFIASGNESPKYAMEREVLRDENGELYSDEQLVESMVDGGLVSKEFAMSENFMNYYIPIYRNDLIMMSKFECNEINKIDSNIFVMYGEDDEILRNEQLHDWDNFSDKKVMYETFKGGHFYLTDIKETMRDKIMEYIKICEE